MKDQYRVLLAKNGEKALNTARDQNPDLILLDVMMPEMDGHEDRISPPTTNISLCIPCWNR
ncbi:MAG: response regulator [Bacteroidota bacterium]